MYDLGKDVPQDSAEAVKWYGNAADQGNADARHNLGIMYASGQGVAKDYVLAHMWFDLAASRYPSSDREKREKSVRNRDRVASGMTPAQISEAQKLAREWKPKSER
jgi:TPR repeat protein